jgi:hypothetical protein
MPVQVWGKVWGIRALPIAFQRLLSELQPSKVTRVLGRLPPKPGQERAYSMMIQRKILPKRHWMAILVLASAVPSPLAQAQQRD